MPTTKEKIVYDHVVYPIICPISAPIMGVEGQQVISFRIILIISKN